MDLQSDAFGFTWGQVRSWTGLNEGSQNGNGWMDTSLPYLNIARNQYSGGHGGIVTVVEGGAAAHEFMVDYSGTTFQPRYFSDAKFEYVPSYISGGTNAPGEFRLTDDAGNVTSFYDVARDGVSAQNGYGYLTDANGKVYPRLSENQGGVYTN